MQPGPARRHFNVGTPRLVDDLLRPLSILLVFGFLQLSRSIPPTCDWYRTKPRPSKLADDLRAVLKSHQLAGWLVLACLLGCCAWYGGFVRCSSPFLSMRSSFRHPTQCGRGLSSDNASGSLKRASITPLPKSAVAFAAPRGAESVRRYRRKSLRPRDPVRDCRERKIRDASARLGAPARRRCKRCNRQATGAGRRRATRRSRWRRRGARGSGDPVCV
jgi:hypothetical protein